MKKRNIIHVDTGSVEIHDPDSGDFVFQTSTGPVPSDVLFTTYSTIILLILRYSITYTQLGAMEQTSTQARDWIVKVDLWRLIFQRDYPIAFAKATRESDNAITMSRPYQERLNAISDIQERDHIITYWKRYYQLMVRPMVYRPDTIKDLNSTYVVTLALEAIAQNDALVNHNDAFPLQMHAPMPVDETTVCFLFYVFGTGPNDVQANTNIPMVQFYTGEKKGEMLVRLVNATPRIVAGRRLENEQPLRSIDGFSYTRVSVHPQAIVVSKIPVISEKNGDALLN